MHQTGARPARQRDGPRRRRQRSGPFARTEGPSRRPGGHAPVLSLLSMLLCISSTLASSRWYCCSATCRSLLEDARLAFLASSTLCRSLIARSRSQHDCFKVSTSELSESCRCWLLRPCSACACSRVLSAASCACSSAFSLRAWRDRQTAVLTFGTLSHLCPVSHSERCHDRPGRQSAVSTGALRREAPRLPDPVAWRRDGRPQRRRVLQPSPGGGTAPRTCSSCTRRHRAGQHSGQQCQHPLTHWDAGKHTGPKNRKPCKRVQDARRMNTGSPRRRGTVRPRSGEDGLAERVCREDRRHTGAGAQSGRTTGPAARSTDRGASRRPGPRSTSTRRAMGVVCQGQHHGDQPPSRPTGGRTLKGTELPEQARCDFTASASPQRSQRVSRWLTRRGPGSDTRAEETSAQENEEGGTTETAVGQSERVAPSVSTVPRQDGVDVARTHTLGVAPRSAPRGQSGRPRPGAACVEAPRSQLRLRPRPLPAVREKRPRWGRAGSQGRRLWLSRPLRRVDRTDLLQLPTGELNVEGRKTVFQARANQTEPSS